MGFVFVEYLGIWVVLIRRWFSFLLFDGLIHEIVWKVGLNIPFLFGILGVQIDELMMGCL